MNARREVVEHIRRTFNLPKEPYKTAFGLPDIMLPSERELPRLEQFLSPVPDVEGPEGVEQPQEHPESVSVLGSYRRMRSPGLITLYKHNLTQFFWRLALDIERSLPGIQWTEDDLHKLAEWTVDTTFWHERFHHSMDVLCHLLDVQTFNVWQEEALAVAFSRYYLIHEEYGYRYRRRDSPQAVIWDEFMKLAYQYQSPGYRDWLHYADPSALKAGICDYLAPKKVLMIKSVRIPVADMLFEWLPVENGFEERLI